MSVNEIKNRNKTFSSEQAQYKWILLNNRTRFQGLIVKSWGSVVYKKKRKRKREGAKNWQANLQVRRYWIETLKKLTNPECKIFFLKCCIKKCWQYNKQGAWNMDMEIAFKYTR